MVACSPPRDYRVPSRNVEVPWLRPAQLRKPQNDTNFGTQVQCRSQKLQKSVIYLSEICQKTVSYIKQSDKSQICVWFQSENCQIQKSVRKESEKFWKSLRNVSVFINVSENCQLVIWKTVRKVSEISLLTDIWHIYTHGMKHWQETFTNKNCQKTVKWHIYDTFMQLCWNILHA